jgi:hypothetical protein
MAQGGMAHLPAAQAYHAPGGMTPGAVTHILAGHAHPAVGGMAHAPAQHGRDKIDWSPEVWHRIDAAVNEEMRRSTGRETGASLSNDRCVLTSL